MLHDFVLLIEQHLSQLSIGDTRSGSGAQEAEVQKAKAWAA